MDTPLTVGTLRAALKGLPGNTPVEVCTDFDAVGERQGFARSVTVVNVRVTSVDTRCDSVVIDA